jgi:hypothetical protein
LRLSNLSDLSLHQYPSVLWDLLFQYRLLRLNLLRQPPQLHRSHHSNPLRLWDPSRRPYLWRQ